MPQSTRQDTEAKIVEAAHRTRGPHGPIEASLGERGGYAHRKCWRTDAGEHRSALLENVFALGGDADEGQLLHYAGVAARRYHEDKLGARVKVRAADRIQYAQFNEAMRKARDERTEKRLTLRAIDIALRMNSTLVSLKMDCRRVWGEQGQSTIYQILKRLFTSRSGVFGL